MKDNAYTQQLLRERNKKLKELKESEDEVINALFLERVPQIAEVYFKTFLGEGFKNARRMHFKEFLTKKGVNIENLSDERIDDLAINEHKIAYTHYFLDPQTPIEFESPEHLAKIFYSLNDASALMDNINEMFFQFHDIKLYKYIAFLADSKDFDRRLETFEYLDEYLKERLKLERINDEK